MTSPTSGMLVFALGGAISRLPEDATAIADRATPFALECSASWQDSSGGEPHIQWARDSWTALRPFAARGMYVNLMNDEGGERVKTAYPEANYARLVALKNRYDPANLFRLNQNIAPAV